MYQSVSIPALNSNWNTGSDGATVTLTDENGVPYNLGKVQNFHVTLIEEDVTLRVLQTTRELHQTERYGYKGEMTIARENGDLEYLEYQQMLRKRQGLSELYFTLDHFINNRDQTTNHHKYTNCRIKLTDHGEYTPGKSVDMKLEFTAEDKDVLS